MKLSIYNSFTRKKEEFKPIHKNFVGMYVCGPTVYGPPHVGHARSYVNFDTVRRYFEYLGNTVKYVQNITDVGHIVGDADVGEDKILVQAQKENTDPYALAYSYENLYFKYVDMLNVKRPTISARATGFIPEMIDLVQKIIDKGFAYVTDKGNVYFSVRKYNEYGKLSNRKIEHNLSGERIELADDKQFPEDFALWKSAAGGHIMRWNSPWGVGYPGWHIECSAISKKFLGETFDIHGGGLDNIFPHHDSEIAQSEVANGKPFVNYFMHNNLITVEGTKMGKSLGNFITLDELFKKFDPMLVRYFILQFHYRKPVDFSEAGIESLKDQFEKIKNAFIQIKNASKGVFEPVNNEFLLSVKNGFEAAMNDDFNTPLAITELLKFVKQVNGLVADQNLAKQANYIVKMFEDVLGFEAKCDTINLVNECHEDELLNLIANIRSKLREDKNYQMSDYIRDELAKLNINVQDKKLK